MRSHVLLLAFALPLAGCENAITLSLSASGALEARSVQLGVKSVRLQDDAGNVVELDSGDTAVRDLLALRDGGQLTLLNDVALARGRYTGLALVFAPEGAQIETSAGTFPIEVPADPPFAPVDFTVLRKDAASVRASLDVRLSLSDRTAVDGTWQLIPRLNVVNLDTDATLSGSIAPQVRNSAACLQGGSAPAGAAVYAWPAAGVTPEDESASAAAHAVATAVVAWNADGSGRYQFPHLAAGDYTLALNCASAQDDPQAAQGQPFAASGEVSLGEGESGTLDFAGAAAD